MSSTAGAGANWRCVVTSASGSTRQGGEASDLQRTGKMVEWRGRPGEVEVDVRRGPCPVTREKASTRARKLRDRKWLRGRLIGTAEAVPLQRRAW